ncbi:inner membrane protein YohK [Thalassotalea insulae]|uniref:Inner membrane protein YohK n=1 Tax=Thalassotalea insulae TaxID=2056778 RepID=A0ABQ6GXN8_9GAMM|nr:LrgB family protein [Thalassotalea insulae]GLX79367.1 inner membrane protein YohK [Thalassotalea insulae]
MALILSSIGYSMFTIAVYQMFSWLQAKTRILWLNPMLLTVLALIGCLLLAKVNYQVYQESTQLLSYLLEPAVVILGYPLYQQLASIRKQWKQITLLLTLATTVAISVSYLITVMLIEMSAIAVSLSLKSITTAIGLALTEQLNGNSAITAFAIILAGLFGAIWGIKWLNFIGVSSANAQGLAIGAASHALGTATVSQLSYQHAAYSSLALILSATITAVIAPGLIHYLSIML